MASPQRPRRRGTARAQPHSIDGHTQWSIPGPDRAPHEPSRPYEGCRNGNLQLVPHRWPPACTGCTALDRVAS